MNATLRSPDELAIDLGRGAILVFLNALRDEDCLLGFERVDWHAHGDLVFSDPRGYYVELNYLDVVSGLADGVVLICELWNRESLKSRYLVHRDYADEFRYLEKDDEVRIRRAILSPATTI